MTPLGRIKEIAKNKGLSLQKLAEQAGIELPEGKDVMLGSHNNLSYRKYRLPKIIPREMCVKALKQTASVARIKLSAIPRLLKT